VAVPTWKMFPAVACGNTVVFKPSEDAPHTGMLLVRTMEEAGFPAGVVNLVQGGADAGQALVDHPNVQAISFTGSSETGARIGAACGRQHKRFSLEMGGKNPMIVLDDADLDLALEGVLWGAFGTTGQRCTATSRLILQNGIHDRFVDSLVKTVERLRLGYGNDDGVDVGPLINQNALEKVTRYVEIGQSEGAELRIGGRRAEGAGLDEGYFFEPTIFTGVRREMRIAREEIFGPVLSVFRVTSYEEAVATANDSIYGLSSSIYTRDVALAFRAMQDLEAGITYINGPTIGAEAHMPFGGVKSTGNGHREGGWEVFDFYTETKTVYVDYSGRLQKAQIDTET
ncbi:MAG TPA: aldehyde dehydrogenase family protein, partial [Rhodothermales bacterium]